MDYKQAIKQLNVETKARLVTGGSFWKTEPCPELGLSSAHLSDGPNGMRVQTKRPSQLGMGKSLAATCLPTASAVACSFNLQLAQEAGALIGREAAAQNVSMVLGPGLNVKRSPLCGRNFEYFSEDTYLSGKMAAAYVRGIQSTGVTACIKHFAANCREFARMYCDSRVDEQTLRETYLTNFEIAVKEGGAGAVMSAYNKLNGEYCNQNPRLLNRILREEWGFNGLVVSDWGGSHSPVKALKAGADLEMPQCRMSAEEIVNAVHCGELKEEVLDAAVERIAAFVRRSDSIARVHYNIEEHDALARRIAEESLVLLKNDGALPVNPAQRVAVIGDFAKNPRYQGAGSSQVNPAKLTNLLSALRASGLNLIGYKKGFKRSGGKSKRLINAAVRLAKKADILLVCLGLDEQGEAEGSDRQSLKINKNQTELLAALGKTGKKIAVILTCGSAVETDWDEGCNALLLAHLSGQAGACAVAEAVAGKVNPSGRLAETYPVNCGDEPCSKLYSQSPLKTDFAEGIFVGYKYYSTFAKPVKYPFGHGLSYTQFSYSDFKTDKSGVTVTVKNTGAVGGATAVQIYVKAPRSNVLINPWELKLFTKLYLNSGEQKTVHLPFDEYTFRIFNPKTNGFEKGGKYGISLMENAATPIFTEEITLEGEQPDCGAPQEYNEYYKSRITEEAEGYKVYKKMPADGQMQVADLRYCRGATAKLFGYIQRRSHRSKDKMKSGMLEWLPVRTLMQFMGLSHTQSQGFLLMCDGKFFKGLKKLLSRKNRY